jgi:hypothetical protein
MKFYLFEDLPTTWGSAEIDQALSRAEEVEFLVKLNELECGSGAVTLLLCHVIELIKPILGLLQLLSHLILNIFLYTMAIIFAII